VLVARGAVEAERLVDEELARHGVSGHDEGSANDDTDREQLRWNFLKLADPLCDGVRALFLLGHRHGGRFLCTYELANFL